MRVRFDAGQYLRAPDAARRLGHLAAIVVGRQEPFPIGTSLTGKGLVFSQLIEEHRIN